jgi:hypothetical protein
MISDLNNVVLTAVVDGSMQTFIQQEGATQSVGEFSTVNVIANSYQLISSDCQLKDPVIITEPGKVQSSAPLVSSTVIGPMVLLLISIVAC